jgi:hypothetical protein
MQTSKKKRKKFVDRAGRMANVVISNNFWKLVALATRIFLPLVILLRIVDGEEKQPIGFVYGGLNDAIKEVKAAFQNNQDLFELYVKTITDGMKSRLDKEIHKATYYLNYYCYYRDSKDIQKDPSIMNSIFNCVACFYSDAKIQDIVMSVEIHNF